MIHISKKEIQEFERLYRIQLINSLSGYKSANLIGTKSLDGQPNLAIFSSVIHLGSNPALLAFIMRPTTVPRHTYDNIKQSGTYTINHIQYPFVENAHFTSFKFELDESEFENCGLSEEYLGNHSAPFVAESRIKMGMKLVDEVKIEANQTIMMIGEIQDIYMPKESLLENGKVDLALQNNVCISGVDTYHKVADEISFPYPKRHNLPNFRS